MLSDGLVARMSSTHVCAETRRVAAGQTKQRGEDRLYADASGAVTVRSNGRFTIEISSNVVRHNT